MKTLARARSHQFTVARLKMMKATAHPTTAATIEAKMRGAVVPDENRQLERQHGDEVHAPDPQSHCQRAAKSPGNAAPASGGPNALRDLDGDVGADRGDYDGQNDEGRAVGLFDHRR